jgi:hypothetical protein
MSAISLDARIRPRCSLGWAKPYRSIVGLVALMGCATSCARVPPYERGTLARSDMELGKNPDLSAGEDHGLAYREGSSGGGDAKGGGCGCN